MHLRTPEPGGMERSLRIRVLAVDDSAVMRSLLRTALGTTPQIELVATAQDGREALEAIERLDPDLVLLDVEMPCMNGLDVLAEMRARRLQAKVIICSTLTRRGAGITLEALARGAMDYVSKPIAQDASEGIAALRRELLPKILALFPPGAGSARWNFHTGHRWSLAYPDLRGVEHSGCAGDRRVDGRAGRAGKAFACAAGGFSPAGSHCPAYASPLYRAPRGAGSTARARFPFAKLRLGHKSAGAAFIWRVATGIWKLPAHPREVRCACTREIRQTSAALPSICSFVPPPRFTERACWRLFLPEWDPMVSMAAGRCVRREDESWCRTGPPARCGVCPERSREKGWRIRFYRWSRLRERLRVSQDNRDGGSFPATTAGKALISCPAKMWILLTSGRSCLQSPRTCWTLRGIISLSRGCRIC